MSLPLIKKLGNILKKTSNNDTTDYRILKIILPICLVDTTRSLLLCWEGNSNKKTYFIKTRTTTKKQVGD